MSALAGQEKCQTTPIFSQNLCVLERSSLVVEQSGL